jgi:histone arginine demethylase JMJD6
MISNGNKLKSENKIKDKVKLYNLKSERFYYGDMSESARESIKDAKLKQRSDLKLYDWEKLNFKEDNWCSEIIRNPPESPLKISYENYEDLSLEDFQSKYEKLNKPLIIKGLTNKWRAGSRWNFEVS